MAEFPKLTPPPVGSIPQSTATIHIEMMADGSFRCTFPENPVIGIGMLEIAKDIFLTKIKETSANRVQPVTGVLPPRRS